MRNIYSIRCVFIDIVCIISDFIYVFIILYNFLYNINIFYKDINNNNTLRNKGTKAVTGSFSKGTLLCLLGSNMYTLSTKYVPKQGTKMDPLGTN